MEAAEDENMSDSDESDGSTSGELTGRGDDHAVADDGLTETSVAFKFLVTGAGDYHYKSSTPRRLLLSEFIDPELHIYCRFLSDVLEPCIKEYLIKNNRHREH